MMDEYSRIFRKTTFGVITGKPVSLGGSEGREDATARGGWFVIREAAKDFGIVLEGAKVAIQGFGNVGAHAAIIGQEQYSVRVVAVSDSRGGVFAREGLDVPALLEHKKKTGSVMDFPDARNITNEELLALDVDILIPAALENVITIDNASRVKARFIAEFANGPVSGDADALLHARGVPILPDILCNGGGVIVSYLEMVQNFNLDHWERGEVIARLEKKMVDAYRAVYNLASGNNVPMRQAGYTIAVGRVVKAMKYRGWV